MLFDDPGALIAAIERGALPPADRPATLRAALLVTPAGFRVNEAAATDNRYMVPGTPVDLERAHAQHRQLADTLLGLGVPVLLVPGLEGLDDAVFPNNVYATTPDRAILGAMRHPVRQREAARPDVRALFADVLRREVVDLSARAGSLVAELTGPLVVDRARGVGLCGLTGRCDRAGAEAMHAAFDLRLSFLFELLPAEYHTNLVLAVLAGRACVIHPASFQDPAAADAIARLYPERTLVLTDEEKASFCGNCIAVNERTVLMSAIALAALRDSSRAALLAWGFEVVGVDVSELEKGGGSLRCLVAEIF